ncbi:MAG TPA: hypothetical protein VLX92_11255 [Kofleriaceae bacterium]|nr:hypothetical protein [Kofleriaceae bacterium]
MSITLDRNQAQVLREILQAELMQLRVESARTDTHAYRERLHDREHTVEQVLAMLAEPRVTAR